MLGDDAVGQIARALRGAAGQQHDIASRERASQRGFERAFVIRKGAKGHRLAAGLRNGRCQDRAV